MTTNNTATATLRDLRAQRLRQGHTQTTLARDAGVALNTVRNAEAGLPVRHDIRERLERVLGATLDLAEAA